MDEVSPLISPDTARYLYWSMVVSGALITLHFAYRFFVLRQIDKHGFHDEALQRLHLKMLEADRRRIISRTGMELVYAVGCGIVTILIGIYGHA